MASIEKINKELEDFFSGIETYDEYEEFREKFYKLFEALSQIYHIDVEMGRKKTIIVDMFPVDSFEATVALLKVRENGKKI